jgi:hypothetical protein
MGAVMKIKVSEATPVQLDWMVANPGKVSRYMPLVERIHRQSLPHANGCRLWAGKRNQHGYGMCKHEGKEQRAHRLLYFTQNPQADTSLVIMHSCDNPACVAPSHLTLGTVRDNVLDMHAKGRFNGGAKAGNKNATGNTGWMKGGIVKMKGYVASRLGDEVEIPEELK